MSVTGCPYQAEDAIHNAFARLFAADHQPRRLKPYVFRSVRNAAVDLVRASRRRETAGSEAIEIYAVNHHAPAEADPDDRERLVKAMAGLPAEEHEVIVLRLNAGLKFREIAAVLDLPKGTVASRYRRGIERLRQEMNTP